MEVWRALLYAAIIFVTLGVISLIVAAIMKLIYSIVHRKENKSEPTVASQ
jgi:hypothetical protein